MLGVYFEPHYAIVRNFETKVICLISILDDIYDAYGTYEELEIFTKAIQRSYKTYIHFYFKSLEVNIFY
ncbi:hypothetical protein Gotur_012383 [Gossypium turneri]